MTTLTNFINESIKQSHLNVSTENNTEATEPDASKKTNWVAIQSEDAPQSTNYIVNIDSTLAKIYKALVEEGIVLRAEAKLSSSPFPGIN